MAQMKRKQWSEWGILVCAAFLALFLVAGCASTGSKTAGGEAGEEMEKGPAPTYYDFGDVLIPTELSVDKKSSFVFKATNFSAGVLSLKGRVESDSLIRFFTTNMAKDNWRQVASFKSPRSVIMFQKDNRWCMINITDKSFSTYVEIWVAPTIGGFAEGILK